MNNLMKAAIAELLGTFTLVFIGGMVVTVAPQFGVVAAALGHGLILVGIIYTYGHISGAHVNPAVTAGLLVGGKIDIQKAVFYWVAQFVGAIIAAILVAQLSTTDAIAANNLGQTTGALTESNIAAAGLIEFILTFFLVSAVYQAAVYGKAGNLAGVAIGLTLAGSILAGGFFTGASLNPARTLGPAIAAGDLSYVPVYLIAIFAGGIVAGLVHTFILNPDKE